jgi:hypothetical protein
VVICLLHPFITISPVVDKTHSAIIKKKDGVIQGTTIPRFAHGNMEIEQRIDDAGVLRGSSAGRHHHGGESRSASSEPG